MELLGLIAVLTLSAGLSAAAARAILEASVLVMSRASARRLPADAYVEE